MGPQFFQTRMGQKFYEGDFPRLVKVLENISKSLEDENKTEAKEKLKEILSQVGDKEEVSISVEMLKDILK